MDENNVVEEMDETEEQEEEILTCPVCGEEVEPGTENCPLCGAPVGTLENNTISGTSIDNSAAIDAMLQSAAMLVEESASLGVALDDDEEDSGEEETEQEEEEEGEDEGEGEDTAEADPMEPANITAMPSDLTDEQKSKIEAGGMINLNAGAPAPAPKKPAPKKKAKKEPKEPKAPKAPKIPKEPPVLYNMDEKGNPVPDDEEEAPYVPPVKKEPRPKKKGGSASPVLVIAVALVALALGCAVGFFGKLMLFPDVVLPECQEFAERAVIGVNSVTQEELYIAEAYVKEGGDSTQCVFRAFADKVDTVESRWYRVKVYNDAPDTVRIYFQLDMDAYQAMMNSDDGEQRIQASMLMNNQQELERCISEIENGTGGWSTANASMLNDTLRPLPEESSENNE